MNMRERRHIGLGVILIAVGLIWLLNSMGLLTFSIERAFFHLWPLIFIVIGINVIFRGSSVVRLITWLAFLVILIAYGAYYYPSNGEYRNIRTESYVIERRIETKACRLNVNTGAAALGMKSGTGNLVDVSSNLPDTQYDTVYASGNENADVSIGTKETGDVFGLENFENRRLDLNLNENVVYNLNLKFGAGAGNLNLSKVKLGNADIDMGAGSLDMYLGGNVDASNIKLNAGASSVKLYLPKDAGIKVITNNALTGTNIDRLDFSREGKQYISRNYYNSAKKINIDVHMGLGSFDINLL